MIKKLTFVFLIFSLLFVSCSNKKLKKTELKILTESQTVTVKAEIAKEREERAHGYMERKVIPDGTGMIFIFEQDQILSFWMKNTPHPLSIAFIDSHGTIRDIFDMKPYSLSSTVSTVSVRYALEVPQGWFEKNNIKKGDKVDLSPILKY